VNEKNLEFYLDVTPQSFTSKTSSTVALSDFRSRQGSG
jgi:hypothetical protein